MTMEPLPWYGGAERSEITRLVEALHHAVAEIPVAAAAAVLAQLGGLTLALSARLAAGAGAREGRASVECLSLPELAKRLRLGESTLRKMVESGEFEEGVHFSRIRRRLIFFWEPIAQRIRTRPALPETDAVTAIPFERTGRRRG